MDPVIPLLCDCVMFHVYDLPMWEGPRVVIPQIFIEPLLDARPSAVYTSKQRQHIPFSYKFTLSFIPLPWEPAWM